jgi:hypothetical protein
VQAFLHDEFTVFCRPAPSEFNDHQRDVFCVFSNEGVNRLRNYLNADAANHPYDAEGTMYDDNEGDVHGNVAGNPSNHWVLQLVHHAQNGHAQATFPPQVLQHPQFHTLLPPPPPPAPQLQQQPFNQHPQQQHLPPLQIPPPQPMAGDGSPNAMSPTNDAPLTLDDDDENFGEGSEMLMGPETTP